MESLKVILLKVPKFYQELHKLSLELIPETKRYYKISPSITNLPNIDEMPDSDLLSIFSYPNLRQILHVSYGELLKRAELQSRFFEILE